MKREIHSNSDPLLRLLDEWEVQTEPRAGFEQRLQARLREAETQNKLAGWWTAWRQHMIHGWPTMGMVAAAAAVILVVAVGVFVQQGPGSNPFKPQVATVQMAQVDPMVRDLQALDRDGELLDHLDFLSAPQPAVASPRVQDRN